MTFMTTPRISRGMTLAAATLATLVALAPTLASAQAAAPVNDRPNPYRTVEGWAKMPVGRTWGSTSAVAIDRDGRSVWVGERCGQNSCVGSDLDPILLFNERGELVRSFGKGLINWPHGMHVDHEGNVWVTDARDNRPVPARGAAGAAPATPAPMPAKITGHQVHKFSPRGELLLSLGTEGGARAPGYLWQPNAVLVAPNGDIFVAEGHASNAQATARILKFDKTGKFLMEWGSWGKGDGQFDQPHALAMTRRGASSSVTAGTTASSSTPRTGSSSTPGSSSRGPAGSSSTRTTSSTSPTQSRGRSIRRVPSGSAGSGSATRGPARSRTSSPIR